LKKQGLLPSKKFGQNFLIDKGVPKDMVSVAELNPEDVVLEIGPGIGTLTQQLAKEAKKVIAVEKDREMITILKETLKDFKNIEIVNADILKWNPKYKIQDTKYKVVGNLPFYLTAPVIRKFLESVKTKPELMVLVVQKEVGQRMCSKPPRSNLLAVSVQFYADTKIISYISKNSFWPQPKVDAAIVKIAPRSLPMGDKETFFKIVKAGFSQPRKQLINNLSKGLKMDRQKTKTWLLKNGVQSTQRAETLTIKNWINLTKTFKTKY